MKNKDTVQRRKPKLDKQSVYSMSFGEWLRKQLKDKRMSNAELARVMHRAVSK